MEKKSLTYAILLHREIIFVSVPYHKEERENVQQNDKEIY